MTLPKMYAVNRRASQCSGVPPLILSFSQQARLGELASQRGRIRKRMRLEKGRLNSARSVQHRSLSPSAFACECGPCKLQARQGELAERDRVRGDSPRIISSLPIPATAFRRI